MEMYDNLKALRKQLKKEQDKVYDDNENLPKDQTNKYRSHDEMMAADMYWDELDEKIYYIGKALRMLKRAMY